MPMPRPANPGSRTKVRSACLTRLYLEGDPAVAVPAIELEASTVNSRSTGTCSAFWISSAQL